MQIYDDVYVIMEILAFESKEDLFLFLCNINPC